MYIQHLISFWLRFGLHQLLRKISGFLAAQFHCVYQLFGDGQEAHSGFFAENSCLLQLETRLMRSVRVNQNSEVAGRELKDTKMLCRAEGKLQSSEIQSM